MAQAAILRVLIAEASVSSSRSF